LHRATYHGHNEIAELLIVEGAEVNAKNRDGFTPLHYAAGKGLKEVVELLIAKGADVNAKGRGLEKSPLLLAAYDGHKEIVELLIGWGADVNVKFLDGRTTLNWVIKELHPETAALLRKHGAKTAEELEAAGN
jgi:cytohesin